MRSNSFLALLALVLMAPTGCCVNRLGCDSGPRLNAGYGCDSAAVRSDSGCDQRCSTGLQGRVGGGLLSRCGGGVGPCATDNCADGSCSSTWTGPLGMMSITRSNGCNDGSCGIGGDRGGGLFSGNACRDGACSGGRGLGAGGGMFAQGYSDAGGAGNGIALAGGAGAGLGCGRFGCGRNGRLCSSCRMRGGRNHPYGGEIPHTDPYMYGGWGGMGDGSGFGQGPVNYAYPYYTTRGPRDFLMNNPPSIGW